jgi:hypothetical protein
MIITLVPDCRACARLCKASASRSFAQGGSVGGGEIEQGSEVVILVLQLEDPLLKALVDCERTSEWDRWLLTSR